MGKSLKGKECGRGISQRKDGRWEARYINRFGKRKSLYGSTYNEVIDKLRTAEYEDGQKRSSFDDKITMDEWYKIWIVTYKEKQCKNTTVATYERTYRHWISPEIGDVKVKDLTSIHLQKIINKVEAKSTRSLVRSVLVNMLKYATKCEIIPKNVAAYLDIKRPNDKNQEATFLSNEQIDLIMKYSEGLIINDIYRFALQTGMRCGEIIGLTWNNVDYKNNLIHVTQQLVTVKDPETNKWINEVHTPKSQAGIRDIPMTQEVKDILKKQKEKNNIIKFPNKADYVFLTKNSNPHFRASISKMSDQLRNKIQKDYPDFPNFSPHTFRHTFATRMIKAGVKPKVLQKILGHKQLQTTMDLYCHVEDDQIFEAMRIFENGVQMAYK